MPRGVRGVFGGQALLVEGVAGLVEDAEERLVEVVRGVARRDPAVAGAEAAAKRVGRLVEPAGVEVEADRGGGGLAEQLLPIDRVVAVDDLAVRRPARGGDGREQRHQFAAQGGEDAR